MMATRNSSQRLKVASLTVIQQSFCLQEGRISASQLLHPVVAELYPFFAHVNEALLQWIDHKGHENASDEVSVIIHARKHFETPFLTPPLMLLGL